MSTGKALRAVSVGEVMVEMIRPVRVLPVPNSTYVLTDEPRAIGGAAVNVAWHLAHLGWSTRIVSPIGERDLLGITRELAPANVDLDGLMLLEGHSDMLIALLTRDQHQSVYLLASLPSHFSELLRDGRTSSDLLVLNGGRHPEVREFYGSHDVRMGASQVVFNPSYATTEYSPSELRRVLEQVNIVILNADEHSYLVEALGAASIARFVDQPYRVLLVTRGVAGVDVHSGTGVLRMPSRVHRNGVFLGAGDALLSGFASALAVGEELESAVHFGLEAAAQVVRTAKIRPRLDPVEIRSSLLADGR